ncbi:MAG: CoA transferase [Alphaproteobacteria bacterium]|nr:CoA transferase [Alphaproteobacteria bacterium]
MLEHLKVVEYATYMAAPGAGGILADWGADVVKVEPPGGDPARLFFATIGADMGANPVYEFDNRNKRGVSLDTSKEAGREALKRLAQWADVFITNVRPGGLERAGLDYENLAKLNPKLIYATVTGYGLTGEDKDRPGFDIASFWARAGLAAAFAPKGSDPVPIRSAVGDHTTSLAVAAGVLAAVAERTQTGKGRLVEASLLRTAHFVMGTDFSIQHAFGRLASARPRREAVSPFANFFKTGDGQWVCFVPRQSNTDWHGYCRAFGRADLIEDPRYATAKLRRENVGMLVDAIDEAVGAMRFADLAKALDEQDVAWAPVQTPAQAVADPQLAAAGGVVDAPQADGSMMKAPAGPVRFNAGEGPKTPAPKTGEHTREVLAIVGYSDAEIDAMIASGAARESA